MAAKWQPNGYAKIDLETKIAYAAQQISSILWSFVYWHLTIFLYLWGILIENGAKRRKKITLMILAYGSAENVNNRLLGLLSSSILRVYSPLPSSWVILFKFSVCFWDLKGCVLIEGGAKRRKNQLNHFSPRLDDRRHFKLCW